MTVSNDPSDLLKDTLNSIHTVSPEILNEYVQSWETVSLVKNENLLSPGQTQKYLYFIYDGVVKSYFVNDGKEHVVAFGHDYSLIGNLQSLLKKEPSEVAVECITDCKILRIYYDKHLNLIDQYPELMKLIKIALELILVGVLERYNQLMAYSIENRFRAFTERSPHLINIIPHKDLASYLRIDKTNFSKLLNSVKI